MWLSGRDSSVNHKTLGSIPNETETEAEREQGFDSYKEKEQQIYK